MRYKEYEGKKILKETGVSVPAGDVARTAKEAAKIAAEIGGPVALKAQVLAGGRGLAGGVKFADTEAEVLENAEILLNTQIRGLDVEEILVEEKLKIKKEYYVSIMLNRAIKKPVMLGTTEGGMSIEKLGEENPEMIAQREINPLVGVYDYHGLELFSGFDLPAEVRKKVARIITNLYKVFKEKEAFLVEINPLVITEDDQVLAADCKLITDPEASYVKKEVTPRYIPLEGDIGVLANGAGLTMTTMDVIKEYGGNPANFLEVGGDFYKRANEALELLLDKRKDLKGLIVNLFGAYARTDVITRQVVDVLKERDLKIPVSFRIRGTGEQEARAIVEKELGKKVHLNIQDAAQELLASI